MSATFNRGALRKLAAAGRLVAVGFYHFDDTYGESRERNAELPVVFPRPADFADRKEGVEARAGPPTRAATGWSLWSFTRT